jgi:hypothetical protein
MKIFRLAVRAVVLLTTGPALLALTACTVSSVAILLTIAGHLTSGQAVGLAPSFASAPAIATAPAVSPAPAGRSASAGGSAAAVASVPVDSPSPPDSPVQAPAASPRRSVGMPPDARGHEFGNGTVYYAWITGVRQGRPGKVTMEMAWHYTGRAAKRYAAEHHVRRPLDDHIDVDRRFAVTVTVSPRARISINSERRGPRQLPASAFLARAARALAVRVSGQFAGPLYEVAFHNDVLVSAYQVFQP